MAFIPSKDNLRDLTTNDLLIEILLELRRLNTMTQEISDIEVSVDEVRDQRIQ